MELILSIVLAGSLFVLGIFGACILTKIIKSKLPSQDKVQVGECIHKFEPRYSEAPNVELFKGFYQMQNIAREILYYKIYIYDICVKCGKKITK